MKIKQKKCKICKELFTPFNSLAKACSPTCAIELVKQDNKRKADKDAKALRKRDREAKIRLKKRSEWLKEAQAEFNRYVRIRDKDQPCISCGKYEHELKIKHFISMVCGHYLTVGGFPELRFNPLNAHLQCTRCNGGAGKYGQFNSKALTVTKEYRINLIDKIGLSNIEWLEGPHMAQKWTIEEIKEIKQYYKELIKELKDAA